MTDDITLSDVQADAVKRTVEWFKTRTRDQQIWRIFGWAGTGKSTILKYALAEMGDIAWIAGTFTGKAANVLRRKGTPCSTIHSMLYTPTEPTKDTIEKAKAELVELVKQGPPDGVAQLLWRAQVRDRENQIQNMYRPTFVLNTESVIHDHDLVVLDEVSMVGEEMAADLMSFGKPILVLGDPGQLPPIRGEGAFTQAEPDILLTEIHRQAEDSAIIRLATMAREGKFIPYGEHSPEVFKIKRTDITPEMMLRGDQVLCGFNAVRLQLNNAMKAAAGYGNILPIGDAKQKVIALKNQHDIGIINGMFLKVLETQEPTEKAFRARLESEDGTDFGWRSVYSGHFLDHDSFDKERGQKDHWDKKGKTEATWGWAITVHKAQGSQWGNVILYDDGFGRGDDRKRWLYTAISRAEEGLLILA